MNGSRKASEISYGWGDVTIDLALLLILPAAIIAFQYSPSYPAKWMALDLSSPMAIAIYGRLIGHISTHHLLVNLSGLVVTGLALYGYAVWAVEIDSYRTVMVASILVTPLVTATGLWLLYSNSGDLPTIAGASDIPLALIGATASLYLRGVWDGPDFKTLVEVAVVLLIPGLVAGTAVWYGTYWPIFLIVVLILVFIFLDLGRRNSYSHLFEARSLDNFDIWFGLYLSALLVSMVVSTVRIDPGPVSQIAHLFGFMAGLAYGGLV